MRCSAEELNGKEEKSRGCRGGSHPAASRLEEEEECTLLLPGKSVVVRTDADDLRSRSDGVTYRRHRLPRRRGDRPLFGGLSDLVGYQYRVGLFSTVEVKIKISFSYMHI